MPPRAPANRTGFQAWLHTVPPPRWMPGTRRRRHHGSIRHAYHHPVEGSFMAVGGCLAGMLMLLVWLVAIEFWFLEVMLWACVWTYFALGLACLWIYRRNIIGQTVRTLTGRRTVRAEYDPHGAPRYPVDLGALGSQDPYDTDRPRSRS